MPVVLTGKQGMVVASGSMDVKKGLEGVGYWSTLVTLMLIFSEGIAVASDLTNQCVYTLIYSLLYTVMN